MKKRLSIRRRIAAVILSLIVLLTGCWNNRPLKTLSIVSAVGIDLAGDGVEVSLQLIKASAMGTTEAQAVSPEKAVLTVQLAGTTQHYDARNLFSTVLPKQGYFNHILLFVISEELAKKGVADILEFQDRDHEYDVNELLVISKGVKASTVIYTESEADKIPAKHIADTIRNTVATAQNCETDVYDFLAKINTEGQEATAGVFQFREGSDHSNLMQMDVRGTAAFKGDKLVGWLDPEETQGLNIIENKAEGAVFDIHNPLAEGKFYNWEFVSNTTSVEAVIKDGKPSINVKAEPVGTINYVNGEFPVNVSTVKTMTEAAGERIKKIIENTVHKAQHEFKSDIFGFGHKIYQTDPAYWNTIKDNWDTMFQTLPVNVEVNAQTKEFGANLTYERVHIK